MRNELIRGTKGWVPWAKVSMDKVVTKNAENPKLGCWNLLKTLRRGQMVVRLGEKNAEAGKWKPLYYPLTKLFEFAEKRKSPASTWGGRARRDPAAAQGIRGVGWKVKAGAHKTQWSHRADSGKHTQAKATQSVWKWAEGANHAKRMVSGTGWRTSARSLPSKEKDPEQPQLSRSTGEPTRKPTRTCLRAHLAQDNFEDVSFVLQWWWKEELK